MQRWSLLPLTAVLFALSANAQTIRINTNSDLPGAALSQSYSQTLTAAGGSGGYTFAIDSGALPAGLNLSSGGVIAGTPTAIGTATFTVRVTDSTSTRTVKYFNLDVAASPLSIGSLNPTTSRGALTNFTYTASGGTPPYSYYISSGSIPFGLQGPSATGAFTGVVRDMPGTFNIVMEVIDAQNRRATLPSTITVNPVITPTLPTPPTFFVGQDVDFDMSPTGGFASPTIAITGMGLPSGLSLTAGGRVRGVPNLAISGPADLTVTDGAGTSTPFNRTFTVVNAPSLTITSVSPLPTAVVGTSYFYVLQTSPPNPYLVWSVTSGALPPGITLQFDDGGLSGLPTTSGTYSFTVQADAGGGVLASKSFTMVVAASTLTWNASGSTPNLIAFNPNTVSLNSFNLPVTGTPILLTGSLPPGMTLNSNYELTGTPHATGFFSFLLEATGTDGQKVSKGFETVVVSPSGLSISPLSTTLSPWAVGVRLSGAYSASGGSANLRFDISAGSLPPGTTLNGSGLLSGTATTPGTYNYTVRVTDGEGATATLNDSITVQTTIGDLSISPASLPPTTIGAPYAVQLSAPTGTPTVTYTLYSGTPPPGFAVPNDGNQIEGPATAGGLYNFTMLEQDGSAPRTGGPLILLKDYSVLVGGAPAPVISNLSPNTTTAGGSAFTLTVSGANLTPGSVIVFNGTDLTPTTRLLNGNLTATVPAGLLTSPATVPVRVRTADSQLSAPSNFVISESLTIISMSPNPVAAGSGAFTLTVNGTGFDPMATVTFNGSNRSTTFVNSTQVTAQILAADIASAGTPQIRVVNVLPPASNALTLNVNNAPVISNITPTSGFAGGPQFTLTVNGSNFVSGAVVTFAGTDTTTNFVNSGQLTATIPASLILTSGAKAVRVRNPDGLLSNSDTFTANTAGNPVLTSLNPTSIPAGNATFTLTADGNTFVNGAVVIFNGTDLATTFVNGTQLTASVPSALVASPGVATVQIKNPGGALSGTLNFPINAAPAISSLTPTSGFAGGPQFTLTVDGSNFISGAVVTFAGTDTTTTFVNSGRVTATIPASLITTTGAKIVRVRNPDGQLSNSDTFTVNSAGSPVLTSLSPTSIPAGNPTFTLTANGSSFVSGAVVVFNGTDLVTNFVNGNQLTASVPSSLVASPGVAPVQVRNVGSLVSGTVNFPINAAPSITSINPSAVTAGGPTFTLNITGTNFQSGAVVSVSNTPVGTTYVSATSLTAQVPSSLIATPATLQVKVANPDTQTSGNTPLEVHAAPSISSLSPASATAGGAAFPMTVNGANFVSGAVVSFNGTNLSTAFVSASQLTAQVTATLIATAGTASVIVTNPDTIQSSPANFNINPPAAILTSLQPTSITPEFALGGPTGGVRIFGQNFVPGSLFGGSQASIDNVAVTTTFVSATEVVALIPVAQLQTSRTASIRVQNPSAANSNALPLIVRPQPVITTLNPASKLAGDPQFTLTVTGSGFLDRPSGNTAGSTVTWNNAALATTYVNATQLTAVVPANLLVQPGTAQVRVANIDGQASAPVNFQIISPVPVLTQLNPNAVDAGTFDFNFAIIGQGFRGDMIAEWDGIQLTTGLDSPTQMRAYVPAGLAARAGVFPIIVRNSAGVASNALDFTVRRANAPSITTLEPATIPAGSPQQQVRITGLSFFPDTVAVFKGTPLTTLFVTRTQVIAVVPANLILTPGVGTMVIRNVDGQESAPRNFFITGPGPQLTSLTPNSAQDGSPTITVNVEGIGFQSGASVRWNGSDIQTAYNSPALLQAVVPAALLTTPGTATVIVRNPDNQTTSSLPFTITSTTPPPQITTLNPPSSVAGGPSFTLSVTGANFQAGVVLRWNGQDLATTYGSSTQLSASIAASLIAAPGIATLTVRNPDGQASTGTPYTVTQTPPPAISGLLPASVVAGGPAFTLYVNGSNFVSGAVVRFNNQDLPTAYVAANQLSATVPAASIAATGNASITVRNPDGALSNAATLGITSLASPSITSLNPGTVAAGSPAFALTVTGANFTSGAVVRFAGQDLPTTYVSATQLTAAVAALLVSNAGTAAITVRNPDQQVSNAATLTVTAIAFPPPILSGMTPNQLPVGTAGTTLVLSGSNFRTGAVAIWNGSPLLTTYVNAAQLTASVPASLLSFPGAANVQVRNPDNQTSGAQAFFITVVVPQITSLSPLSVLAGTQDVTLVVSGVNFRSGATVRFNGSILPTTFITSTQVSANVVPASLLAVAGTAAVTLVNPDGQASTSITFTIVNPQPQISSVNPSILGTGTPNAQITVTGSNFHALAQVRWNGIALPTISGGANQLTAVVNSGLLAQAATASITVRNPDQQISNSVTVQVIESRQPEITQLTPGSIAVNSRGFALIVKGNNYLNGSAVLWSGQALETTYTSAQQLTANVPAALLTSLGTVNVAVRNPDGKTSATTPFLIGEALRIITTELPPGVVGDAYETALFAAGGSRPYKWRLGSDSARLPANLTFGEDGILRGIPQAEGTFALVLEAVDAVGGVERLRTPLVIRPRELDITSTSPLPPATAGSPYSYRLTASGGPGATYLWSVVQGVLPAGLTLNAQTGEISGIAVEPPDPTAPEARANRAASGPINFGFRIQVAIAERAPFRKQFELSVLPATGSFRITTPTPLEESTQSKPVRLQIAAAAGTLPYTLAAQGRLPNGVTFDPSGVLVGVPTESGSFPLSVTARDSSGRTASQSYDWRVGPPSNGPVITSGPLLPITALGQPTVYILEAAQGAQPFQWAITSGSLPAGLTFDPVQGRLTGATAETGIFRFTARVTDATGMVDTRVLELPITATGAALQLATTTLPGATLGRPYAASLNLSGGQGPYTCTRSGGELPGGLTFANLQIQGTPTGVGSSSFTLTCTDTFGFRVTRDFAILVTLEALPSITINGLPDNIRPGEQPQFTLEATRPYPAEIRGTMTLTFVPTPAIAGVDAMIRLITGGTSVAFTIPANGTRAVFTGSPVMALQTGTVAGTATLQATFQVAGQTVTAANRLDRNVAIVQLAPVINQVLLEKRTGGFTLTIDGFSTTREVAELTMVLTAVPGRDLQTTRLTLALGAAFKSWYDSAASLPFGTQFRLMFPFDGDPAAIQSLTLRLRNSIGESADQRVNF